MKWLSNKQPKTVYHELSYEILRDSYDDLYTFGFKFDDYSSYYIFDIAALKASTMVDDNFPIICCSCGVMGCGGAYVTTRINKDEIIWERFWDCQSVDPFEKEDELFEFDLSFSNNAETEHLIIKPPIYFKLDKYKSLAYELWEEVMKFRKYDNYLQETLERYLSGDTFGM